MATSIKNQDEKDNNTIYTANYKYRYPKGQLVANIIWGIGGGGLESKNISMYWLEVNISIISKVVNYL